LASGLSLPPCSVAELAYDTLKDFAPVTLLAKTPSIFAVHPSLPVKSVKELIALARARPGQINYAGGAGSTNHLDAEYFKSLAKVDIVQVPYQRHRRSLIGVLSGEASIIIAPTLVVLPHMRSGRLKALAVTSLQRSAAIPKFPRSTNQGCQVSKTAQWYGILLPAGAPEPVVTRLNVESVRIVQTPEFAARLAREGSIPQGTSPQEFAIYFRNEIAKWQKAIRMSGARAE